MAGPVGQGRRAGVPASTLRTWENDRGSPTAPAFLRLAKALGVPPERLAEVRRNGAGGRLAARNRTTSGRGFRLPARALPGRRVGPVAAAAGRVRVRLLLGPSQPLPPARRPPAPAAHAMCWTLPASPAIGPIPNYGNQTIPVAGSSTRSRVTAFFTVVGRGHRRGPRGRNDRRDGA
jgi:hypothetical protein